MKKTLLIICILLLMISAKASHIVGGEFELRYIGDNEYRLSLIYYFDQKNNPTRSPSVEEPSITVSIFRKSDNSLVRSEILFFLSPVTDVNYTNDACSKGEIITDKLI